MKRIIWLFVLLISITSLAFAEPFCKDYEDCLQKADMDQGHGMQQEAIYVQLALCYKMDEISKRGDLK